MTYPRVDGTTLPPWAAVHPLSKEVLIEQVPHRLQRLMYESNAVDVPAAEFAAHVAAADIRLKALLRESACARSYFKGWTFAAVADTTNREAAAEAEYHLCDALIEYGFMHSEEPGHPVLDTALKGLYAEKRHA
ncbi:hypothetical protein ACFXGM_23370 [Streptomyces albidoflavus]